MNLSKTAQLLLRAGVAFAFLYAAIDGFVEPYSWIDFFPAFLASLAPAVTLLKIWGAAEIILALWIVWGRAAWLSGAIATLLLVGIVLFNPAEFQLLFRDLSIAAAALALALDSWNQRYAQLT